jgi:DNA recombination protein RmuC
MPPALQAMTVALAALAVVLLLVVLLRLPRPDGTAGLVQQQLVELRSRLDGLVAAQRALPATLAEGAREQLGVLGDVRDRLGALQATTRQLERLGQSVGEVERLLQVPKLRGTIGERWLEQLLADVMPSGSFELQYAFRSGERVDAVIRVGDRLVPVDAKFPLEACRRMLLAASEEASAEAARSCGRCAPGSTRSPTATSGRRRTRSSSPQRTSRRSVYYEAVVRDAGTEGADGVLEYALARKVVPVSPHTFYAYLLVVLHGLRGLEVEARAREILDGLGALRQQFDAFWTAHGKVGSHLANAARQYEESVRLRGRVEDGFARLASAPEEGGAG